MSVRLPRRAFLRGVGASVALPWLEAMTPAGARAADGPLRVLYYYVPSGVHMRAWTPGDEGPGWSPSPILEPVHDADLADRVTVISGLRNEPVNVRDDGGHFRGTAGLLTARAIVRDRIQNGISIDQVAASEIGHRTPFRSLPIGLMRGGTALCGSGWPCPYLANISWSSETTFLDKEIDPGALFDRLFADPDIRADAEARRRRRALGLSVLDFVREDAGRVRDRIGRGDRERMDEYLDAVRELERRIESGRTPTCDAGARPDGGSYRDRIEQMQDLMVLALRCDLTRIVTFMTWAGGASDNNLSVFRWLTADRAPDGSHIDPIEVRETKHDCSHHGGNEERIAQLQAISTWEVERFCRFVSALEAIDLGGRTLLDDCLVVFTSEYGDGNRHVAEELPVLVAGGGAGHFAQRGHLALPAGTRWSDFLRTVLGYQGVEVDGFGDSSGLLSL